MIAGLFLLLFDALEWYPAAPHGRTGLAVRGLALPPRVWLVASCNSTNVATLSKEYERLSWVPRMRMPLDSELVEVIRDVALVADRLATCCVGRRLSMYVRSGDPWSGRLVVCSDSTRNRSDARQSLVTHTIADWDAFSIGASVLGDSHCDWSSRCVSGMFGSRVYGDLLRASFDLHALPCTNR